MVCFDVFLYDLMSMYFDFVCLDDEVDKCCYVYSCDKCIDCVYVLIVFIVTFDVFLLGYELLVCNISDKITLCGMLCKIEV